MRTLVLLLSLTLLLAASARAQDEIVDEPADEGVQAGLYFHFVYPMHFLDVEPFSDDLDAANLPDFSPFQQYLFQADFGLDFYWDADALRLGFGFGSLQMDEHRDKRYAEFNDEYFDLLAGYARRIGRYVQPYADARLKFGTWTYNLHSPALHGRAHQGYVAAAPEVGLELIYPPVGIGFSGSYRWVVGRYGGLYSGDFDEADYEDLDIDRAVVRAYIILGYWSELGKKKRD